MISLFDIIYFSLGFTFFLAPPIKELFRDRATMMRFPCPMHKQIYSNMGLITCPTPSFVLRTPWLLLPLAHAEPCSLVFHCFGEVGRRSLGLDPKPETTTVQASGFIRTERQIVPPLAEICHTGLGNPRMALWLASVHRSRIGSGGDALL